MSLSGMTGFGRRERALGDWTWAVEARSVNGRNLEVRFRGPPGFDALERVAREAAQARFQRGQINVNVQAKRARASGEVRINSDLAERYLAAGEAWVAAGRATAPTADGLLSLPGVIETRDADDDEETRGAVEAAMAADIGAAFDDLRAARGDEGAALAEVIGGILDQIEALTTRAGAEAATQPAVIRDRLQRRLIELAGEAASEERILLEAAAAATKADVREELDRLGAHIIAGRTLLDQAAASGRRLDFLTQEFMREANTLCAKSALTDLTSVGLELKAAIDQLREQVQNVE
jgi:uncharacterized protein (TIGR00255 family)